MSSNLPPGVTNAMIDPPDVPCEMCGNYTDDCICPECPVCHVYGDPKCYEEHGLVSSPEQDEGRRKRAARDQYDPTDYL